MLTYTTVENLHWVNPEHTTFDCEVFFEQLNEKVPFACCNSDPLSHAQEIWNKAMNGEFGPIAEYVEPVLPEATEPQPIVNGAQTL